MLTVYRWKGLCLMQCVKDVAEVVGWVVHAGNITAAWVMVVIMLWASIVTNGCKVVPLKQPTLVDEDRISILAGIHYQYGLE